MWSGDPLSDGGISVLGALLAAGHFAGAFGIVRRAGWGRRLGLVMGVIGLFGSASVLLILGASLLARGPGAGAPPGLLLAIPAATVITYAVIVAILVRARNEFSLT